MSKTVRTMVDIHHPMDIHIYPMIYIYPMDDGHTYDQYMPMKLNY